MITLHVIGDWGWDGGPDQRHVAMAMARAARARPPAAIVTTGDNVYQDGVASADDPLWRIAHQEVYAAPELEVPWYPCLGNHDHRGSIDAQLQRGAFDPRWQLRERCYSIAFEVALGVEAHLFFLDTTVFVGDYRRGGLWEIPGLEAPEEAAQLQVGWLDAQLARSDAAWKIVVGHHPIASASPFHGDTLELRERIQPLLERHGVELVLAGHEHDLQHLVEGGVHYAISGSAGSARETGHDERTRFAAGELGFLELGLGAERLELVFRGVERELYRTAIERSLAGR